MTTVPFVSYSSPFGRGRLYFHGDRLVECALPSADADATGDDDAPEPIRTLARELDGYWSAARPLPLWRGLASSAATTPLLESIYERVLAIPEGAVMTYAAVAQAVGRPRAARTVGAAMARNPFAPLIPCHRVVGSDGSLRGYGGGLAMKRFLLEMESHPG